MSNVVRIYVSAAILCFSFLALTDKFFLSETWTKTLISSTAVTASVILFNLWRRKRNGGKGLSDDSTDHV
ncbi:MAG: hypothetical protein ACYC1I_05480 [Acidimicrobiales bacterium]